MNLNTVHIYCKQLQIQHFPKSLDADPVLIYSIQSDISSHEKKVKMCENSIFDDVLIN
jgi:hypothetical protein